MKKDILTILLGVMIVAPIVFAISSDSAELWLLAAAYGLVISRKTRNFWPRLWESCRTIAAKLGM